MSSDHPARQKEEISPEEDGHRRSRTILLMENQIIFLLVCGIFSGFCFVIGCTASVIKAVRERRRILKNRAERGQIEDRGIELLDSQPEKHNQFLTKGKGNDYQNNSGKLGRHRKAGRSGHPANEELEADFESMETSFHSCSDNVPMCVVEKTYGAHSQATDLVLDDEIMDEPEKDNEIIDNDGKDEDNKGFGRPKIQQDYNGSSGTFLLDTDPPVVRTKSYQAAMAKKVVTDEPASPTHHEKI